MTAAEATLEAFEPCIGQEFLIGDGGTSYPVKLAVAASLPVSHCVRKSQPFQLQFHSAEHSAAGFLPQRIYTVSHERLGRMEMFLVPVGPPRDGRGGLLYQAIFY